MLTVLPTARGRGFPSLAPGEAAFHGGDCTLVARTHMQSLCGLSSRQGQAGHSQMVSLLKMNVRV